MVQVISYDELKKMIDLKEDFVLLDIREAHEMKNGMIPSAINLPMSQFEAAFSLEGNELLRKYGIDKEKLLVLYCRTGGRSTRASEYLEMKGFIVKNFKGSVQEWSKYDKNVKMY